MPPTHAFRRRIKTGFAFVVVLAASITIASLFALRSVIHAKDEVITEHAHDLVLTRELELASEQSASGDRAFLLTRDSRYLDKARAARVRFEEKVEALKASSPMPEESRLLEEVLKAAGLHQTAMDQAVSAERTRDDPRRAAEVFETIVQPKRESLGMALEGLVREKERLLQDAILKSREGAGDAMLFVASLGIAAAVLAGVLFYLSVRTLTRLAEAEAEIRDLNENLERRVQERTREIEGFAYAVAHDLRAPARAMAGFSSILLEEQASRLDASGRDFARRIHDSALRMDDLINGILSLARLSYEAYTLVPVDLLEVSREVTGSRESEIRAARARIEVDVPSIKVLGDPSLLSLSLDHLVANALKFVPAGVVPDVLIRAELRDGSARISVRDNGTGIPPEYQQRVFGVFERLHPAEEVPGVGIGLAIVRRAVHRMGGMVGVHSNPGEGATFWIELRLVSASAEKSDLHPARSPGLSGAH